MRYTGCSGFYSVSVAHRRKLLILVTNGRSSGACRWLTIFAIARWTAVDGVLHSWEQWNIDGLECASEEPKDEWFL